MSQRANGTGADLKRLFDVVTAIAGIGILSPLLLGIALFVKLSSPGPVLYRGWRTGLHGRQFRILKFRTMTVDAEKAGGVHTARNDPRIIPGGRFLRKYKLDEWPQLFNVLRGEMSIVGPRPEVAEYTDRYTGMERLILSVRPGITDYSSIEFASLGDVLGDEDTYGVFERVVLPKKNFLRLKYVQERNMLVDLRIIVETFAVIMKKMARR